LTIDKQLKGQTEKAAANSAFAIGGVSCSADSLVVAESFVLRMNICAEKPTQKAGFRVPKTVLWLTKHSFYK
jgi:hypothetical protein